MNFIPNAGVWEVAVAGQCVQCGGAGGHAYVLERSDTQSPMFCDEHCWGRWWDQHAELTGTLPARTEPDVPWQPELWALDQKVWGATLPDEPGISRRTRTSKYLIYRDPDGHLLGLVRRFPNGAIFVFVDPAYRNQGIGKVLTRAAGREWGISDTTQRITAEGRALSSRIHPGRKS